MAGGFRYIACGLAIASDLPIPGLASVDHAKSPDLRVEAIRHRRSRGTAGEERVRYVSRERHEDGTPQLTVWTTSSGAHRFLYRDGTEFIINEDATIVAVRWEEPMTAEDAAVYLVGPVLGFVTRLRGIVPLHASAVVIGSGATVFVGEAGAGKSTTAGAFAALGYGVLSDDLLPLVETQGRILAHPSYPRLTMWPDSARALFGSSDELPALTPTYDKRYLDLQSGQRFRDAPLALQVIYVLGGRTRTSPGLTVRPLRPPAALMALVTNTYGNYLLDETMRAREFDVLSRVARDVPVRLITFGDDIDQLLESCQLLVDRVQAEATPDFYE
jgi:hypothetical protein